MHSLKKVFTRNQGHMFTLWEWVFLTKIWCTFVFGGVFDEVVEYLLAVQTRGQDLGYFWEQCQCQSWCGSSKLKLVCRLVDARAPANNISSFCVPRNQVNTEVENHVCPCSTQETDGNVIYCYHVAFKIYSWDLTINLTFTSFDWAAKVSGRLTCDQHDSLRDTRFFV